MKYLTLVLCLFSLGALAQPPWQENHLGGVYDRQLGGYVPGSGTAAPRIGAPLFQLRPAAPAPQPPALPAGASETFNVYSRGNDDVNERDEAGVSNYETARVRLSAFTLPRPGGGTTIGIRYVATLQTNEEQAAVIGGLGSLVCGNDNLNVALRPGPMRLVLQRPPGGSARGATLTAQLSLGGMTAQNGTFTGTCAIAFRGGADVRQVIRWRATVANGQVSGVTTSLVENDAGGGRPGSEILRLIESNENPRPTLGTAFPARVGQPRGTSQYGAN